MLLRIIDSYIPTTESFTIESYSSPFSDNFYKTLTWYFTNYLQDMERRSDDIGVAEKLIKFGQYMGDELLGEDHQLIRFINIIEQQGYENLQVQFESGRVEFFNELWEAAILPESKYVLAAAVKGYVRQFVGKDFPTDFPELHYNLKVNAPSQDKVARILQGNTTAKKNISSHKPLRVLYIITRPDGLELPFASSNCINLCLDAIVTDSPVVHSHFALRWSGDR
jgi:hypothetical protein